MRFTQFRLFVAILIVGCSEAPTAPVIEVELINPAGDNPASIGFTNLQVELAEGDAAAEIFESEINEGVFDLPIKVQQFSETLSIRSQLNAPMDALIGAPPKFKLGVTGGLVRIAMQRPGTCERLSNVRLPSSHLGAFARNDTFLFSFGDEDDSQISFVDLLRLETGEIDLALSLRPTRAVALSPSKTLLMDDDGLAVIFSPGEVAESQLVTVELHQGASAESALVRRGVSGVAVVAGSASKGVTWISAEGLVSYTELRVARTNASAVWLGRDVMVIGGGGGVSLVSVSAPLGISQGEVAAELESRTGVLIPSGDELLWLSSETAQQIWLSGCPTACQVSAETELSLSDPLVSDDRILSESKAYRFENHRIYLEQELALSSSGAAVASFDSGVFVTAGGMEDDKAVQICAPDRLFFE